MKANQHIDDLDDQMLFDLIGKMPLEKAPEGFNEGIMQQIYSGFEPIEDTPEYRRQMLWGYMAIGAVVVISILMMFAQWPFLKINFLSNQDQLRDFLNAGIGIVDGFSKVLGYIRSSSNMLIIFLALGLLLIFERLIRRGISTDKSLIF